MSIVCNGFKPSIKTKIPFNVSVDERFIEVMFVFNFPVHELLTVCGHSVLYSCLNMEKDVRVRGKHGVIRNEKCSFANSVSVPYKKLHANYHCAIFLKLYLSLSCLLIFTERSVLLGLQVEHLIIVQKTYATYYTINWNYLTTFESSLPIALAQFTRTSSPLPLVLAVSIDLNSVK